MLSIRLQRVGRKNAPTYRVVVMPKTRDPQAVAVEIVGHYNPRANPKEIVFKDERVKHWLSKGAQPTPSVQNLLISQNLLEGKKKTASHISKTRGAKMEEKLAEAKAKAEEAAAKAKEAEEAAKAEAEAAKAAEAEAATAKAAAEAAPAEEPKAEEAPAETSAE